MEDGSESVSTGRSTQAIAPEDGKTALRSAVNGKLGSCVSIDTIGYTLQKTRLFGSMSEMFFKLQESL